MVTQVAPRMPPVHVVQLVDRPRARIGPRGPAMVQELLCARARPSRYCRQALRAGGSLMTICSMQINTSNLGQFLMFLL